MSTIQNAIIWDVCGIFISLQHILNYKTNRHFKTAEDIKGLFFDYCRIKLEITNRKIF